MAASDFIDAGAAKSKDKTVKEKHGRGGL